jgi:hypothetical protein
VNWLDPSPQGSVASIEKGAICRVGETGSA